MKKKKIDEAKRTDDKRNDMDVLTVKMRQIKNMARKMKIKLKRLL